MTAYNLRVNERTPVARLVEQEEQLDLAQLVGWRTFVTATAEELGFVAITLAHVPPPRRPRQRFEDLTALGEQFSAGLSARSRLADVIYRNHSGFSAYMERVERGESPVEEVFQLSEEGLKTRFLASTIGDGKPLERAASEERFASTFDGDFGEALQRLADAGLVDDDGARISLSETGKLVYDLVLLAFYPEPVRKRIQARQSA